LAETGHHMNGRSMKSIPVIRYSAHLYLLFGVT